MSSKVVIEDEHDEEMTSQPTKPTESKPTPAAAATATATGSSKEESTETKSSDDDDAKAKAQARAEADKEKALGNDFYKKKQFAEATQHYEKAIALDSTNIVYYNNLSAVYMETKEYEKAIETAQRGATIGREHFANYVDIAKAYARIGSAYEKLNKLEEAVEYYNKSLIEDYSDKTKTALKKIEEQRKKEAELAYIDPAKSEEAKLRGNDLFNAGKYVDAIAEYTEAIKRDPKNFKVYSNRAACYQKLMDWGRGLDDCEKCLAMDPTFIKAYIRKAKIQQFLKQYHKALSTCDAALKIEPTNTEVLEVKRSTMYSIQTSEADPERAKEAMKDPAIQAILRDPTISKVLQDMQSNPQSGQAAMRDPDIRSKIETLIAAGVLGTR